MPLVADETAVLHNLYYDSDLDADVETITALTGVSWHGKLIAQASSSGLAAADLYKMRIFAGSSTAKPPGLAEPVNAEDAYLAPDEWAALPAAERAEHWTIQQGDKITCKGQTGTVLAIHDNRAGRLSPHWYVEAH